ncbi:helix-turn-helix domain-containing protein [Rathayibacter sp. Leaf299]|uniref:helix-turn-helix domain-containing protein n=1 Tax=Rathayibacter sp. Leaf299 TaxID=1736328 RepID=UPI000AD78356
MTANAKLISSAEAASELNISLPTLSRWVKAGKVRAAVEGKGIRGPRWFYRSEIARVKQTLERRSAA